MAMPAKMLCERCRRDLGFIASPEPDRLAGMKLEFLCPQCVEKVAESMAITLNSETSWGKLIAEIKSGS